MFSKTQGFVYMVEDHRSSEEGCSVCFSFPSKKPRHSKPSDGDVQKFNTADAGEEPPKETVVLKKFHEYISRFNFSLLHAMPASEGGRRGRSSICFLVVLVLNCIQNNQSSEYSYEVAK